MNWKFTGITAAEAMRITILCIGRMIDSDENGGDGCTPVGKCFIDSLCREKDCWYISFKKLNSNKTFFAGV